VGAKDFLFDTEPAVSHLFDGLATYDSNRPPSILRYVDETGLVKMSKEENQTFLEAHESFFALEFARATLAGSILQVAYLGLKQFSPAGGLDAKCAKFGVAQGTTAQKLCIGREVHGIPIGLLIYAGRIQYNHWEDGQPSGAVAKKVFRELVLAYYDDMNFDMAYELTYPSPRPVSHYIVRLELGWHIYSEYASDMRSMLEIP